MPDNVDTTKSTTSSLNHNVIMSMVADDISLGAQVVRKALTYTGYESKLLQLNNTVQTVMMNTVSSTYGLFCSPNSPIVSNSSVMGLVNRYKELMPVHHASILTMLNIENKLKDKSSLYLVRQYDCLSFWMFLSAMRSCNNHLFTWWANISTAA